MKVSFVIPIYNHFSLVNQLLVDINANTKPDEIIIVDDFSNDTETLDGIAWWAHNYDNIKVLRPIENLGFLKAANYGVSQATGDAVCLISSDVRVEDDLAKLVRELLSADSRLLIGGILYSHDTGWNTFDSKTFPYLEGWLICCLKSAWQDIGGFDEQYAPNDFEDVDISTTAYQKGYTLVQLANPKIRHLGAQTIGYGDERQALTVRNREKFRTKWLQQPQTISPK